jgi:hydroxylamine reductase (hybrid-cluster protein)
VPVPFGSGCYFSYSFRRCGLVGKDESGFCGVFAKMVTMMYFCSDVILNTKLALLVTVITA